METKQVIETFRKIADKVSHEVREEWMEIKAGSADIEKRALERFNALKISLKTSLEELKLDLNLWKSEHQDTLHEVKAKIQDLENLLSAGKAETLHMVEEQRTKILNQWSELRNKVESMPEYKSLRETVKRDITDWRIRMDLWKVQYTLGKMEAGDRLKDFKQEFEERFLIVKEKIEDGAGIVSSKINDFELEMKKLIDKIQKA